MILADGTSPGKRCKNTPAIYRHADAVPLAGYGEASR
jgi:hypothetical protein